MFVIKYRWVFYLISSLLVAASVAALVRFGLNLGTDFRGGTIMEVNYQGSRPAVLAVRQALEPLELSGLTIQPAGDTGFLIRSEAMSEAKHEAAGRALLDLGPVTEKRFSAIGPVLGAELARKGLVAIVLVILLIIIYIAVAFRGVSRPISSWKYGLIAILALIHDVTIPAGVFALLGHYRGVEVDALFLTALLTILGLSVNDTIVVFDRIRENLRRYRSSEFVEIVGRSLNETFMRSFNTSFAVIISLLVLLFVGSETTRYFALALTIGMVVGTYSSIFIASPLLVTWHRFQQRKGGR